MATPKSSILTWPAAGQHDVFRLDVTVHDAVSVRRDQRFGALHRDGEEFVQRQRLAQTLAQILAFDIFQNQEYFAVLFQNVVDRGDVGVAETGGALRLFQEAMAVERIGPQRRCETLEGDGALEFGVLGAIYLAHPAFAEPFSDAEAPNHGSAQGILRLGRAPQSGLDLRHKTRITWFRIEKAASRGLFGTALPGRRRWAILLLAQRPGNRASVVERRERRHQGK